jgi:hypothetical protein
MNKTTRNKGINTKGYCDCMKNGAMLAPVWPGSFVVASSSEVDVGA